MTHPTLRSVVWFSGRLLLTAVMLCDILHGSPKYNRKVLVGIDGFWSGDTCGLRRNSRIGRVFSRSANP